MCRRNLTTIGLGRSLPGEGVPGAGGVPSAVHTVRFQLISKLFGQTLRCVFSVVVVILEVEIKAA